MSRPAVPSDKCIHRRPPCEAREAPELGQARRIQVGTRGNPGRGETPRATGREGRGSFGPHLPALTAVTLHLSPPYRLGTRGTEIEG